MTFGLQFERPMGSLPADMTAIEIDAPGGPEVLRPARRPVPQPARAQVLIEVAAAGVNPHDCNQRRRGTPPAGATDVPGLEVAGTIVAAGADTGDLPAPGTLVCSLVNGGGYAQYCLAEAPLVFAVPAGMSAIEAAGVPEALFTAWFNLVHLGRLSPGEWLLVHGGTGAVASMAIRVAKLLGAKVVATSSSAEKQAICRELGADATIDYTAGDLADAAIAATRGRGVDVILDAIGARYAADNLRSLAVGGRMLHISSWGEDTIALPLRDLMGKRASLTGSLLRPTPLELKTLLANGIRECIWPEVGRTIVPRIDSVFALEQAAEAHRRLESRVHVGKVMLAVARAAPGAH